MPRAVFLATPAPALELPFRWAVRAFLPALAPHLPRGPLTWPISGPPIVAAQVEAAPSAWGTGPAPDVLFAEVTTGPELVRLAEATADEDVSALLFVAPGIDAHARSEAYRASPGLTLIPLVPGREDGACAAARHATEILVRRRAYRQLLGIWGRRLGECRARLERAHLRERPAAPGSEPASLAALENLCVCVALGLWWEPHEPKTARFLEISDGRLRRHRDDRPAGLVAALAPPRDAASVLILEDDAIGAGTVARVLRRVALRLAVEVEVRFAASGAEARAQVQARGPPDVAWIDIVLETPTAGVDFLTWLRKENAATIAVAKSDFGLEDVHQELSRLGVLAIAGGDRGSPDERLEGAGLGAVGGAAATRTGHTVDSAMEKALRAAQEQASAAQARDFVSLLEAELATLEAFHPEDLRSGLPGIERRAARDAWEGADGNKSIAAARLGISVRRLKRLLCPAAGEASSSLGRGLPV